MRPRSILASRSARATPARWLLGLALSLVCLCAAAQALVAVPPLQSRVTDTIGMLTADQRTALDNVLKEQEARTGNQIAVLLMGSTAPEAIEQFSIRVADAWKLGRKGIDDGVILVVARDNPPALRRLRIEAGRGVQGSLTDAQSKRVLEDVIAPHFRQNDFYGGLTAGVASIAAIVARENLPAPEAQQASKDGGAVSWLPLLLFAIFFIVPMFTRGRGRNRLGGNAWGRNAGIILGSGLGSSIGGRGGFGGGGGGFGGGGGGFSGGGGGFDGGGASGNW